VLLVRERELGAEAPPALPAAQPRAELECGEGSAVAGNLSIPVIEFTPAQVKIAVTGYGSADKKAIENMIPRLITLPTKKRLDDEFDAIAVALAGLSTHV
jgi:Holliday junction resolvasome RuvABC endonuclease subunit